MPEINKRFSLQIGEENYVQLDNATQEDARALFEIFVRQLPTSKIASTGSFDHDQALDQLERSKKLVPASDATIRARTQLSDEQQRAIDEAFRKMSELSKQYADYGNSEKLTGAGYISNERSLQVDYSRFDPDVKLGEEL